MGKILKRTVTETFEEVDDDELEGLAGVDDEALDDEDEDSEDESDEPARGVGRAPRHRR